MSEQREADEAVRQGAFQGRHVVVTGGGQGIGYAIADAFAAAGAGVTIMARNVEMLEAARQALAAAHEGRHVRALRVDLADADAVRQGFADAVEALGPVDVLVNNAGASGSAPFGRMTLEHLQAMLDANLRSAFLATQAVIGAMAERGSGRIVNVASTAGLKGYSYVAAYVAAKHAVVGLTRALALEYAGKGVTVNAVCPGFAETPMTIQTVKNIVEKTGRTEEEARRELAKLNPQKRLVQPAEVAEAVLFLALPGAHAVNGQVIAVDGGETA